MLSMTPSQIVKELDRYIIGQADAKRSVAVALRNRYRRSKLAPEQRDEITPKNIIMSGPTGVGKTEIARRISRIIGAPFVKVEATKYTEVGYVGRDVDSMVRELVEASIRLVRSEKTEAMRTKLDKAVQNRMVDILLPLRKQKEGEDAAARRNAVIADLESGVIEEHIIEIEVEDKPVGMNSEVPGQPEVNMGDLLGGLLPKRTKKRRVPVKEARKIIAQQELNRLLDNDAVISEALERAEQDGIIFIDEIDKIAMSGGGSGPAVSREGVQRDILPLVEGCTVNTKYGPVKTDYILFIAAGAFQVARINDLIPELQGRFPLRVELLPLTREDMRRILSATDNALTKQYTALLATDGAELEFTPEALDALADYAYDENEVHENIGARRLVSVMEKLLDEISFSADALNPQKLTVNTEYVNLHLGTSGEKRDLAKYIL
ncbi:MAG: ATP-dependent protease ATPase subunit HslU [Oscillospiraceae bacterium]|nr:MAG: ATP-dependent protease ATPase subunit HslU [Oscillospiraceae bacterium]